MKLLIMQFLPPPVTTPFFGPEVLLSALFYVKKIKWRPIEF
jgi:hypothetical protein